MPTPLPEPPDDATPDLSGMDAVQLSRIWPTQPAGTAAGAANVPAWREQDLAAVLRHQLDAPLAESDLLEAPPPAGVRTFADLLTHPSPPQPLLRRVRDWAKTGRNQRDGDDEFPLPREVAGVLYFACIASELSRLGQWTTGLGPAAVAKGCRWALSRPWLDGRLVAPFNEALSIAGP